jgi:hypothetical protein
VIATVEEDTMFDVFDCAWPCPGCKTLWLSSDGWMETGNLVVPYREDELRAYIVLDGRNAYWLCDDCKRKKEAMFVG